MNAPTTVAALRKGPGANDLLANLLQGPHISRFDPEAYHAMQERDNQLIRDEILHGVSSKKYVYSFNLPGSGVVTGISVVGAAELAAQYKGIKCRIVASVEKRGALFIFRTFEPLSIETRELPSLEEDVDFYECVMEVTDTKTGNSVQVRKSEDRLEKRRNSNEMFVRQHYDTIAESKARRNGILAVLPQSVIEEFKQKCLAAGNASNERTIDQLRAAAAAHAAKHSIGLDRQQLNTLTYDELTGLGGAAAQGIEFFKRSCVALGLVAGQPADQETGEITATPAPTRAPAPAATAAPAQDQTPADDDNAGFGDDTAGAPLPPAASPAPAPAGRRARSTTTPMT